MLVLNIYNQLGIFREVTSFELIHKNPLKALNGANRMTENPIESQRSIINPAG